MSDQAIISLSFGRALSKSEEEDYNQYSTVSLQEARAYHHANGP